MFFKAEQILLKRVPFFFMVGHWSTPHKWGSCQSVLIPIQAVFSSGSLMRHVQQHVSHLHVKKNLGCHFYTCCPRCSWAHPLVQRTQKMVLTPLYYEWPNTLTSIEVLVWRTLRLKVRNFPYFLVKCQLTGFECVILEDAFSMCSVWIQAGRQHSGHKVSLSPYLGQGAGEFIVGKGKVREGLCLGKGTKML